AWVSQDQIDRHAVHFWSNEELLAGEGSGFPFDLPNESFFAYRDVVYGEGAGGLLRIDVATGAPLDPIQLDRDFYFRYIAAGSRYLYGHDGQVIARFTRQGRHVSQVPVPAYANGLWCLEDPAAFR
ncbi:MAG: hypothetical protein KC656_22850, partial [Myxococcales bacterium]|nr:hypothetical protein [Myxococcales bacterium]